MSGVVEDCFGVRRAVRFRWPDGTARCPFCSTPCDALDDCQNPACDASPWATPAISLRRTAEAREREAYLARHRIDYALAYGRR